MILLFSRPVPDGAKDPTHDVAADKGHNNQDHGGTEVKFTYHVGIFDKMQAKNPV